MPLSSKAVRTLVVDDSAFARKIVREMLTGSPAIEVVGAARDGEEALSMIESLSPDVVTCDLTMPKLDGVGFVREQMKRKPLPILLLSSAAEDAELVMEALDAGAVDFVRKPSALATHDLLGIREQLVAKVCAAARATPQLATVPEPVSAPILPPMSSERTRHDIVCIGISTGGPQALRRLVPQFAADFPVPIAIVLHMPVGYTALFAEKLNELSAVEVREAQPGDVLRPGVALIAAAGRHLKLTRAANGDIVAELPVAPLEKLHRPSVDVLFRSAAEVFSHRVLGVVMTGMGDDGKEGAGWVKAAGGTVLTEAEKSCVIYGMPRSVVEAGLSDAAVPLDEMAKVITDHL